MAGSPVEIDQISTNSLVGIKNDKQTSTLDKKRK